MSATERPGEHAYRESGVDLAEGARAVDLIRGLAARATRPEVAGGVGGFAGLVSLGDGRYLSAATDGVGTKLEIARLMGVLDTVGIDLVAMCANDVVCTGAEPLVFLDYLAVGRVEPDRVAAVVAGVAEGCRLAGCALLGGETAEHPGVLAVDGFDLAGFCVGLVREEEILRPGAVRPGDALMGLRSSGLHANGFSLVRRAFLGVAGDEAEMVAILDDVRPGLGRALGRELLEPTRIYVRSLLSLARAGLARSAAHITGGGWHENLPRALPAGLGAQVDAGSWDPDPIFQVVADAAGLALRELFGVLNMGIGMVAVVPAGREDDALAVAREADQDAVMLGRVVEGEGIRIR